MICILEPIAQTATVPGQWLILQQVPLVEILYLILVGLEIMEMMT